ncbi:hypothetical protein JMJ77_0014727 [Colletotrichum scovillei]|uniref:Uncharacterized protein n=1 Tax=Colletotrichum scovillei TaxID=1209932 RepID=A0A9P7R0A8_9PEZI|nr:hypothetical protein JMJ77_0014727 [Colletotrichum scovillei]KAG7056372.1 hypothetical protein JMJ78_0000173 [Colletotrichum scovillei]KAG7066268.1 hypothetical protein JMJ76_0000134 [Colletotrichum scovillei]
MMGGEKSTSTPKSKYFTPACMPDLDRDIRSAGTLGITASALPTTTPHSHLHKQ